MKKELKGITPSLMPKIFANSFKKFFYEKRIERLQMRRIDALRKHIQVSKNSFMKKELKVQVLVTS